MIQSLKEWCALQICFLVSFLATKIYWVNIHSNFPRENFEKHRIITHKMHQNAGMSKC